MFARHKALKLNALPVLLASIILLAATACGSPETSPPPQKVSSSPTSKAASTTQGSINPSDANEHVGSIKNEYFESMMAVFERQSEEREQCAVTRDQKCLTASVIRARDSVGSIVPKGGPELLKAHQDLVAILSRMVVLNQQSDSGTFSQEMATELSSLGKEFVPVMEAWLALATPR